MTWLIKLLGFHIHAWGIWHAGTNGQLVQTCYECSQERLVKIRL